jgi:mannose-1-phosphate guanylyltransferase
MYEALVKIQESWGTENFEKTLGEIYPTLEKASFDNLILEKIDPSDGFVLGADLGWSDVGAWEQLKEALAQTKDDNVTKGKVLITDSTDNLVFNYTDQMTVGIDLKSMLVINTDDVLLICPKDSVPKIKKLVESLSGTPNEHLT